MSKAATKELYDPSVQNAMVGLCMLACVYELKDGRNGGTKYFVAYGARTRYQYVNLVQYVCASPTDVHTYMCMEAHLLARAWHTISPGWPARWGIGWKLPRLRM